MHAFNGTHLACGTAVLQDNHLYTGMGIGMTMAMAMAMVMEMEMVIVMDMATEPNLIKFFEKM